MSESHTFSVGDAVTIRRTMDYGRCGPIMDVIRDTTGGMWYEIQLSDRVVLCRVYHLELDAVKPLPATGGEIHRVSRATD